MFQAEVTRSLNLDEEEHDGRWITAPRIQEGGSFQNEDGPGAGAIRFGQGRIGTYTRYTSYT